MGRHCLGSLQTIHYVTVLQCVVDKVAWYALVQMVFMVSLLLGFGLLWVRTSYSNNVLFRNALVLDGHRSN